MGIFCKIGVLESPNQEFIPGSAVNGSIKYAFDKNTVAKKITISLTGRGVLSITPVIMVNGNPSLASHHDKENYVSLENIILDDYEGKQYSSGEYEAPFNFQLPKNIPASLNYHNSDTYEIKCKIAYKIEIKFEISGFMKFDKKFEKEIKVVPPMTPKLPIAPIIYGERKTFFQPFKTNKAILNLKACIKCSVLEPGEKVEVSYEVQNDTNKPVEAVETKLITIYNFYNDKKIYTTDIHKVKNTDSKTAGIRKGETVETPVDIKIPSDLYCIDNSKLVSREYAVLIKVCLPLPHKNLELKIPVQIGKISVHHPVVTIGKTSVEHGSPPSYWEIMNVSEEKGDNCFFDDVKNEYNTKPGCSNSNELQ